MCVYSFSIIGLTNFCTAGQPDLNPMSEPDFCTAGRPACTGQAIGKASYYRIYIYIYIFSGFKSPDFVGCKVQVASIGGSIYFISLFIYLFFIPFLTGLTT